MGLEGIFGGHPVQPGPPRGGCPKLFPLWPFRSPQEMPAEPLRAPCQGVKLQKGKKQNSNCRKTQAKEVSCGRDRKCLQKFVLLLTQQAEKQFPTLKTKNLIVDVTLKPALNSQLAVFYENSKFLVLFPIKCSTYHRCSVMKSTAAPQG